MVPEVLRQSCLQVGMSCGIRQLEVIHGVDDPSSEKVAPDAIDDGLGKLGSIGQGHPPGQAGSRISNSVLPQGLTGEEHWLNDILVAGVDDRPTLPHHTMALGLTR